jgi:hypothetical protein
LGTVTKLGPDGKPGWTFAIGGTSTVPNSVAARGATFAVAGTSHGSEDFDPGTGIDVVFGDIIFLSRFTF